METAKKAIHSLPVHPFLRRTGLASASLGTTPIASAASSTAVGTESVDDPTPTPHGGNGSSHLLARSGSHPGGNGDEWSVTVARATSPSTSPSSCGTKRCCKQDLKRCLRIGETVEIIRVEQHLLDRYNQGRKIRAQFTGNELYDLDQNRSYRSLSRWVKQRMVDVCALSPTSNISGWDFVSVIRDGTKSSLRVLIESPPSATTNPDTNGETRRAETPSPTLRPVPTSSAMHGNSGALNIAERMRLIDHSIGTNSARRGPVVSSPAPVANVSARVECDSSR